VSGQSRATSVYADELLRRSIYSDTDSSDNWEHALETTARFTVS